MEIIRSRKNAQLRYFRELGFLYATLDLGGYSMGSMNRVLG